MNPRLELIDLFWPETEGRRWWGGWAKFFTPNIPNRVMDRGFDKIRSAITDLEIDPAIEFLTSSHTKYLSQAGRGEQDVECIPTSIALHAAELFQIVKDQHIAPTE